MSKSFQKVTVVLVLAILVLNTTIPSQMALAQGGTIQYNQTVSGTIETRNPIERWTFNGNAGESIEISMRRASGDLDCYLQLVGPNNEVIANNDDDRGSTDSRITVTLATTGAFHILATRYASIEGTTSGNYSLELKTVNQEAVAQSSSSKGIPISYGQSISGTLTASKRIEFYSFTGNARDQITITLTSNQFDTYLGLLSSTDVVLAEDDDGGGQTNSRIQFVIPSSGIYIIAATSYQNEGSGTYTLSLNVGGEQPAQTTQSGSGLTISGTTDLPYQGMFLVEQNRILELIENPGGPPNEGVPTTSNQQPTVYAWVRELDTSLLNLSSETSRGSVDYTIQSLAGGALAFRPRTQLQNGRYCFSQGNIMLPAAFIRHWCFDVVVGGGQGSSVPDQPPPNFVLDSPGFYLYARGEAFPLGQEVVGEPLLQVPETTDPRPNVMVWSDNLSLRHLFLNKIVAGIGTTISSNQGRVLFSEVNPQGAAAAAGLTRNDILLTVNGQEIGASEDLAVSLLRGEVNTSVQVTILRGTQTFATTITRREILTDLIEYSTTPWNTTSIVLQPNSPLPPGRYCYSDESGRRPHPRWCFRVVTVLSSEDPLNRYDLDPGQPYEGSATLQESVRVSLREAGWPEIKIDEILLNVADVAVGCGMTALQLLQVIGSVAQSLPDNTVGGMSAEVIGQAMQLVAYELMKFMDVNDAQSCAESISDLLFSE